MDFHSKKNSLEEAGHKIYYYKDRNGRKRVVVELHGCRDSVPYNLFAQVGEPDRVMQAHGEEVHECDCFVAVDSVNAAFRLVKDFAPLVDWMFLREREIKHMMEEAMEEVRVDWGKDRKELKRVLKQLVVAEHELESVTKHLARAENDAKKLQEEVQEYEAAKALDEYPGAMTSGSSSAAAAAPCTPPPRSTDAATSRSAPAVGSKRARSLGTVRRHIHLDYGM